MSKGFTPLVSGVLTVGILMVSTLLLLQQAKPIFQQIQDAATLEQAKDALISINKKISDVAAEGEGSKRLVHLDVSDGEFRVDEDADWMMFKMSTKAKLAEPRQAIKEGDVYISINSEVKAYEDDYYVLENSHLIVKFRKYDDVTFDNGKVIYEIRFKSTNTTMPIKGLPILIEDSEEYIIGKGYTKLEEVGINLPHGRVIAHLETSNLAYDIYYTLESGADFLMIEVKNIKII
jgi:hypothetical protein